MKPNLDRKKKEVCAVDPGVRSFLTVFSEKEIAIYGEGLEETLYQRLVHLDKLRSKIDLEKRKRNKRRQKDAFARLSKKFQNIQRDIHYKIAKDLCTAYSNIVLPVFDSKSMAQSKQLRTKTVRSMSALAHGKFRTRLVESASMYGATVHNIGEEFTSKTCSSCGWMNENLGSNKVFHCQSCSFTGDRDVNAAKNIFLKALTQGLHA
jgi:putative transposase